MIPPFARATVEDLMRPGILSCHADAHVTEVADTMATHRIHAVVVTGIQTDAVPGDQATTGLVTDVDLIRAAAAHPESLIAGDIARTAAITVEPATPLLDAARVAEITEARDDLSLRSSALATNRRRGRWIREAVGDSCGDLRRPG